jgi:ribonuclease-3
MSGFDRWSPEALLAWQLRIGHVFADPLLLARALTHNSWASEAGVAGRDYQRLEFLGDAVIGLAAARWLHAALPDVQEGVLAACCAAIVSADSLAAVAQQMGAGEAVRLGAGEEAAGARTRPAMLADVFEAIVGAVCVDAGPDTALAVATRWLEPAMQAVADAPAAIAHPKSLLQQWAQAQHRQTVDYVTMGRSGPAHAPHFVVEVRLLGQPLARGEGPSRQAAETEAARKALQTLTGLADGPMPNG